MPITPFIGVRISWLMLARNADFMRDASCACTRATVSCSGQRDAVDNDVGKHPEAVDHAELFFTEERRVSTRPDVQRAEGQLDTVHAERAFVVRDAVLAEHLAFLRHERTTAAPEDADGRRQDDGGDLGLALRAEQIAHRGF